MPLAAAKNVVYDSSRGVLYASVLTGSQAGIVEIDPVSGATGPSLSLNGGAEQLAISDDDHYLYASNLTSIFRIDLSSFAVDLTFPISSAGYHMSQMAVRPQHNDTLAVSLWGSGSPSHRDVVIFRDGVQLPKTESLNGNGADVIQFRDTDTLYGYNNEGYNAILTMSVDDQGITVTNSVQDTIYGNGFKTDSGLIYSSNGQVVDPSTWSIVGTFDPNYASVLELDSNNHRAYFIRQDSGFFRLDVFDTQTYALLSSTHVDAPYSTSLERWGPDGLAYVTSSGIDLLDSTDLVGPVATPALPAPVLLGNGIQLGVRPNGLTYSAMTDRLYASIGGDVLGIGNEVFEINPHTGTIDRAIHVGSDPQRLAVSGDGSTLYVALNGASAFEAVDLATHALLHVDLGRSTSTGPLFARDIVGLPLAHDSAAISLKNYLFSTFYEGVARYDGSVKAPNQAPRSPISDQLVAAGPNLIYGLDQETTGSSIQTMSVDASGVTVVGSASGFFDGRVDMSYADGLIFTTNRFAINTGDWTAVKPFDANASSVLADADSGYVFYATFRGIEVHNISGFALVGVIPPGPQGAFSMVRWGTSGLAYEGNSNSMYIINYDRDGDGVLNVVDNCPAWANAAQELPAWPVPAGDTDCDGFPDSVNIGAPNALASEAFLGTDPTRHCAATPARNDEPGPAAWPVDFDDNQIADGSDLLMFAPVFGSIGPNAPYDPRFDLNNDGRINGSDLLKFAPFFGKHCA